MTTPSLPVSLTSLDLESPASIDALDDFILFTDFDGMVVGGNSKALSSLTEPQGKPFWELFHLDVTDFDEALARFPLDATHEVNSKQSGGVYSLRIVGLPLPIAPHGGFVIIATDVRPIVAMQEHYEEQLEDQHTGWEDTLTLFNALFDGTRDAILLADESFKIIAANTSATKLFTQAKEVLTNRDCRTIIAPRDRGEFDEILRTLPGGSTWNATLTARNLTGTLLPISLSMRRVDLDTYFLFQITIRDLSIRINLEENLQQKEAEVEDMNIALRQVIRTVEEEKQEMKEELAQQVMVQMLPALERIAEEDCLDTRQNYKNVIEEQMVDFVDGTSDSLDAVVLKLTPREVEICRLIQLGKRGKEISELLSISFETLQTHRKNIRRKLSIKGEKVSLYSYLQQSDLSQE